MCFDLVMPVIYRPDITVMVDWALKINYLSMPVMGLFALPLARKSSLLQVLAPKGGRGISDVSPLSGIFFVFWNNWEMSIFVGGMCSTCCHTSLVLAFMHLYSCFC